MAPDGHPLPSQPAHPPPAWPGDLTCCSSPFRRCSYSRICLSCFNAVSTLGTQEFRPVPAAHQPHPPEVQLPETPPSLPPPFQNPAHPGSASSLMLPKPQPVLPSIYAPQRPETPPLARPRPHFCDVRFRRSESLSRLSLARASRKFSFCTDSHVKSRLSSSLWRWTPGEQG